MKGRCLKVALGDSVECDWSRTSKSSSEYSTSITLAISSFGGRSRYFLDNALGGQLNLVGTFKWRTGEEPRYCDVNLFQLRILRLDDVFRLLKAGQNCLVPENDVGGAQLSVRKEKDLELKYPSEIWLVNQVDVGGREILVYRNPKNKSMIKKEVLKKKKILEL